MSQIKVWDNFTRIYHVSQLILLALLWYSGDQGDFENHFIYGFILLALIATRLIWGVIGSQSSRFTHFVKLPWRLPFNNKKALLHSNHGHSPIAGYMVIALLISVCVQLTSGLFATDDVLAEGPLYSYFSDETIEFFDSLHSSNFDVLLILVGIHAIAGLIHQFSGDNVITGILLGKKKADTTLSQSSLFWRSSIIALVIWGLLVVGVFYLNQYLVG